MKRRIVVGTIGALAVGAATHVATGQVAAQTTPTKPKPPFPQPTNPPDIAEIHARQARTVQEFVAQKRDPRTLPRGEIEDYYLAPKSLNTAVKMADTIIVGQVEQTTFVLNPQNGMPLATSMIQVEQTLKGKPRPNLTLLQSGGPMLGTTGEVLLHLESDELVLPGDEAVLLLKHDAGKQGYRTVQGAGVYLLSNGQVNPQDHNPFGASLLGKSEGDFLAAVSAAISST